MTLSCPGCALEIAAPDRTGEPDGWLAPDQWCRDCGGTGRPPVRFVAQTDDESYEVTLATGDRATAPDAESAILAVRTLRRDVTSRVRGAGRQTDAWPAATIRQGDRIVCHVTTGRWL